MRTLTLFITTILFALISTALSGQQLFDIEINSDGAQREVAFLRNLDNGIKSNIKLDITAGTSTNEANLGLSAFGKSYTASPGYGGYGVVTNLDTGIILRAGGTASNIRFMTGGATVASNTRMFINPVGQIGIGTSSPAKKLHISEGDLYMDTASGGEIIIRSPNGSCYSLTVTNAGTLSVIATPGGCPVATN